jgi:hypothetical protein
MKKRILEIVGRDMPEAVPRPLAGERCPRCHRRAGQSRMCRVCSPQKALQAPDPMKNVRPITDKELEDVIASRSFMFVDKRAGSEMITLRLIARIQADAVKLRSGNTKCPGCSYSGSLTLCNRCGKTY